MRDDPDDPMLTFVRQVMGASAQLERGMIRARMQGGASGGEQTASTLEGSDPMATSLNLTGGSFRMKKNKRQSA